MYFLYLDDSGSVNNPDEGYFVLGGAIIPEEKLYWVNKNIDDLAAEFCPEDPFAVEFHACEIFGGRRDFWREIQDKSARIGVLQKILQVACREKLSLLACAVQKKFYPKEAIVSLAFEDIVSRFQSFLSKEHKETGKRTSGMIVFDKSAYEKDIQKLALRFRDQGTAFRDVKAIQEVPLFVDSKASRSIQLADHIAYSVFRRYNANDLTYFNTIQMLFDMHGLSHKTQDPCTCPACLRRSSASD